MNHTDVRDRLAGLLAAELDPSRDDECPAPRQQQTRLSDEQRQKLVADYVAGMSTYRLAEKYAVRRGTAASIIKRHGVTIRSRSEQHAFRAPAHSQPDG